MAEQFIYECHPDYDGFLRDESRSTGNATSIAFPRSEAQLSEVLRQWAGDDVPVTVQGARTGIVAGAVPCGGHVLNLSMMKRVGEIHWNERANAHCLTVEPGVLLSEIRAIAASEGLFFPPDPTETSASIGGMVACNASGAISYAYGPTRDWVQALRVVLVDGSQITLERGQVSAQGRDFVLTTDDGRQLRGVLPDYQRPLVKNAAGYFVDDNMDLLDLFIGMEGTLGVVIEIEVRLLPKPRAIAALTCFLPNEDAALEFVRQVRGSQLPSRPVAIEFFDHQALNLIRQMKDRGAAFSGLPPVQPEYHTAVYLEFHCEQDDALDAVMPVIELLPPLGGDDDATWCATTPHELAQQKAFRHAVPEAVNLLIDERKKLYPSITKLGTDMSVPDGVLAEMLTCYRADLVASGLESVIFGHIGNSHVHVNILPRDEDEYQRGRDLCHGWAQRAVSLGGSVSAEHGIGKLKKPFFQLMYNEGYLIQMHAVKQIFDPADRLNRGNLFS